MANAPRFPRALLFASLLLPALLLGPAARAQSVDADGDGWSPDDGDCADVASGIITRPDLVNPGAFDIPGNGIDDDCDGTIDNSTTGCSASAVLGGVTAFQLASAMDLCQVTTLSPPLASKTWGLISAQLLRATGSLAPNSVQAAVKTHFGSNVVPVAGATLAVLSCGTARDASDPGFIPPSPGFSDAANVVVAPTIFTAPHGGLIHSVSCPQGSTTVYDSARLKLTIRVPTNANLFQVAHRFFSAEYPNTCNTYNDHLICLLSTTDPGIPADRNILFSALATPMTVQTAFFPVCTGCVHGDADLAGTGYPSTSGGTDWGTAAAPVVPGEIITLEFIIWDTGDASMDALALLDDFEWLTIPQDPPASVAPTATPGSFALRASPNPFSGIATIEFVLAVSGRARVEIYDVSGRLVRHLADDEFSAQPQRVAWDGRDDAGVRLASGAYFARLTAANRALTRRVVLGN